ncbi:glutathione S-transferase family protein [Haliangium sp.]|uniref:glutathione S-transferase family protein n=1 Tax=Haliangium sp. TaxID=2663208 RepID=UPI003D12BCCA
MIKIHGASVSPFVRKVRVVLAEKGMAHDLVPVNPLVPSEEFKRITPLGKIPVLQDGDVTVLDSAAIVAYLERSQPTPSIYPDELDEFGRALFYEQVGGARVYATLGPVFVQRIVIAKAMNGTADEAVIQASLSGAPAVFDYLEEEIGDREWLAGGRFSIADISVASPFVNWGYAGEKVDPDKWPKLTAYLARVHARPSFKALIDEEMAALGS